MDARSFAEISYIYIWYAISKCFVLTLSPNLLYCCLCVSMRYLPIKIANKNCQYFPIKIANICHYFFYQYFLTILYFYYYSIYFYLSIYSYYFYIYTYILNTSSFLFCANFLFFISCAKFSLVHKKSRDFLCRDFLLLYSMTSFSSSINVNTLYSSFT